MGQVSNNPNSQRNTYVLIKREMNHIMQNLLLSGSDVRSRAGTIYLVLFQQEYMKF